MIPVLKNVGERSTARNYYPLVCVLWLVKSEELVNNRSIDHLEKLISSMVLGLLDQLQIL